MALVPRSGALYGPGGAEVTREELLSKLMPGRIVAVHQQGPAPWKARLLLCGEALASGADSGVWFVCTPDLQRRLEDVSGSGGASDSAMWLDGSGNTPVSLRGSFYRFRPADYPDDEELLGWHREGIVAVRADGREPVVATRIIGFDGQEVAAPEGFFDGTPGAVPLGPPPLPPPGLPAPARGREPPAGFHLSMIIIYPIIIVYV